MKKTVLCLVSFFFITLTGCRNFFISAEIGSRWVSSDSMIEIEIASESHGTGTFMFDDEVVTIMCHFGPGVSELAVFPITVDSEGYIDGDSWLFRGDYHYDEKAETITFYIAEDHVGLEVNQIVLYRDESQ